MDIQTSIDAIVTELDRLRHSYCITTENEDGVTYTRLKDTQAQEAWEMMTVPFHYHLLRRAKTVPIHECSKCGQVWTSDSDATMLRADCSVVERRPHDISTWPVGAIRGMLMEVINTVWLDYQLVEKLLGFVPVDGNIDSFQWACEPHVLATAFLEALRV